MRILGIDPGYGRTGYGVIDVYGNRLQAAEYGLIETDAALPMERRLQQIYDALRDIIARTSPERLALEQLFFNRNVTTAIAVGQARGVILLAGVQAGLSCAEYTPMQVKQSIVGYGKAEKQQIQEMVKIFLNLAQVPKPDDVADALAIAITDAHMFSFQTSLEMRAKKRGTTS
ncbi:crossover junction endodeoxyribonuclease RuvC [Collibacillus ludicampi]|jgi:crossover junction endodeoxyribonuclease RuvC|uniref:Crossover junction endodeoxyribonuclease RuvC n=1 Tax=Collibacillus ludicampi TaxID=2771369 RepID=A0AAV4LH91_9BACL|nr:crossover junction endodeoxyribonuclease RuvC [Collibacillus ludicampi]GIM47210.1 crossover junction endodeoxyribonuclease RuvC [Collibacillus ludicampi]